METVGRILSSKGYHYFWFAFTVVFMVVDFLTGSFVFAALMAVLAVYWGFQIKKIKDGTNVAYNRYHGVRK